MKKISGGKGDLLQKFVEKNLDATGDVGVTC